MRLRHLIAAGMCAALSFSWTAIASAETDLPPPQRSVTTASVQKPLTKAERAKLSKEEKAKLAKKEEQARKDQAKQAKLAAAKESEKTDASRKRFLINTRLTPVAPTPPAPLPVSEVVANGNNGELRSETAAKPSLFAGLFGGAIQPQMLPQTRALDSVLAEKDRKRKFVVKSEFEPQTVAFSGYERGTIVVKTGERFLYLVESPTSARRYAIAVGREGLEFKGTAKVGDKQEWPRWIPTQDMQKREPKKYGQYKDGMPGGPDNPLGARAIYLYQGKSDTHIRIHGTNQPQTIGTNSSNGCFRMVNEHVMDLYGRVRVGTQVIVL